MEILTADKLDDIIHSLKFIDSEAKKIKDPLLTRYLMYVHVLGRLETRAFTENNFKDIHKLFYNRYYWFVQFKERYFALYGHDEGLEQQSFKMINEYNEKLPEEIDWATIEQIENHSI